MDMYSLRDMQTTNLNLLHALDHLLREGSVSEAARHMGLSPSAVSRSLEHLRGTIGDPLLVRAGRRLVPTPRAEAMRARVQALSEEVHAVLQGKPGRPTAIDSLARTFTIRTSDVAAALLVVPLVKRVQDEAPRVRLWFVPEEGDGGDPEPLRDGRIHLEVGEIGARVPELRLQTLFRDRFVAVVRPGHPLTRGKVTTRRFCSFVHAGVARHGRSIHPVDRALRAHAPGASRTQPVVLPSYHAALALAAQSDLVAVVPEYLVKHQGSFPAVVAVPLPFAVPTAPISQAWHPRHDDDPGHRWLRNTVKAICQPAARG
jgi:DNA-binding transcriptional LysR family regulator